MEKVEFLTGFWDSEFQYTMTIEMNFFFNKNVIEDLIETGRIIVLVLQLLALVVLGACFLTKYRRVGGRIRLLWN